MFDSDPAVPDLPPTDAAGWRRLALARVAREEVWEAESAFRAALELAPASAEAHADLGGLLASLGRATEASELFRAALAIDPGDPRLRHQLAAALAQAEEHAAAAALYRELVALDPTDAVAQHMATALAGETSPRCPPGHVARIFDDYAPRFERHLRVDLDYRAPELLRAALDAVAPGARYRCAVDLGCGTGLVATVVRADVDVLHGVDLAPRMIEESRRKGLYDELFTADLVDHLAAPGPAYDLALAADVFIYLGDLALIFAALRRRLAPGGLFAFSIELLIDGDYALRPSGRYAQSERYIRALAQAHDLRVLHRLAGALRQERRKPMPGLTFVLGVR